MRLLISFLSIFLLSISATTTEDLRGTIWFLYPGDFTLYGSLHDVNNLNDNSFRAQVCWDDPTYTTNCDQPVPANTTQYPQTTCSGNGCTGFHYVVPTGFVGAVNPRDGQPHMLYIKALSKANPGAGDKPVNGSPWPFTYKNGAVAPMWAPNLEGTPIRLKASQLAIIANSQDPYSIGAQGTVVCTVNGVAIRDDGVAGYYARRRNVPCANISVVSLAVTQAMRESTFNSSLLPTVQALSPSLQAIALAWVQPSYITFVIGNDKPMSISAAVANSGMIAGASCYVGQGFNYLAQGPVNPYFNTPSQTPFTDYAIRPTMMLAGETCPLCTATINYLGPWVADVPAAKSVIDAALLASDTDPSGGNIDWALTSDLVRSETAVMVSPLELGNGISHDATAQILGSRSQPYSSDVSDKNILLYAQGAPHWNYNSPSFLPGAGVAYSVTSSSGALPYDGSQTPAASWLSQGAVGAYGNAIEPCELHVYKNPDPALFVPFYTQGQTLIEALWKSVRLPWDANFIGDPLAAPFTLKTSGGVPAPTPPLLKSITPNSAAQGSAVSVTLLGSNFVTPLTVSVQGAGVTASQVVVSGTTSATATLTIAGNAAAGTYDVSVSSSAGSSGTAPFQVTVARAPAPAITNLNPSGGTAGSTAQVVASGTNFTSPASATVSGSGVTVSSVTVNSATRVTIGLAIASSAATGPRSLTVNTAAGASGPATFTVNAASAAPAISTVSPNSATAGSTVNVTIAGSNFGSGAAVAVGGTGVTASNVTVVNAGQISATLTIAANAATGARSLSLSTTAGTSNAATFTINAASPKPTLTSIAPASGTAGTNLDVNLTGTNFVSGATVTVSGTGVMATSVSVASATAVKAVFTLAANATPGTYNVTVATPSGTSTSVPFRVTATSLAPTLASIAPNMGHAGTSVNVTLSGTNFAPDTTIRLAGIGAAIRNLVVVNAAQITATFVLQPSTASGPHNVYVINSSGNSPILAFTVQ